MFPGTLPAPAAYQLHSGDNCQESSSKASCWFPQRSTSGLLLLGFLLLLTNSQQELQPQPLRNTLPAELHNKQGTAGTGPFVRR